MKAMTDTCSVLGLECGLVKCVWDIPNRITSTVQESFREL